MIRLFSARSFWLAAMLAAVALGGCGREMTDREYCVRRHMAWEMAFPLLAQTDDERNRYVDACVVNVAGARLRGDLKRSLACMNDHLVGGGHAYEQFVAFTRCEGVDPTQPAKTPKLR